MYNMREMKKLTGLTSSEIDCWRARGWWLTKTWAGGYFGDDDIVAIACFRRLLALKPEKPPFLYALKQKARSWIKHPPCAHCDGVKLSGVVNQVRGRMKALDREQMGFYEMRMFA